jgi:arylsulfatase A-like enzyme
MNLLLGLAVCLTPLLVAGETPDGPGDRRPNVLLLLADDLGHADVGFNNPETFYETPRLDRLAGEGMRFSAAYAACPVCSPTRASLLAGRWPARMATTDYFGAIQPEAVLEAAKKGKRGRFQKLPLLPASYVNRLPLERVTLAEALREAGYATFFAGKWHLGGEGFSPTEQGFDVNVAGHHRGGPYGPGKYFHPFGMPNLESEPGDHLPARLAEETVKFVRANKAKPWFAMLSFYSVHTPLMGREDLVERYEKKRAKLGLEAAWGTEGERKVRLVQEHAVYAAMVHAMDEAVGTVLDALEELELADDTLVIFFSDNGGLSTSEGHPTSNLPLRAGKGWLYEGGIREPCAVRWPGRIEAGTHSDVPVVSTDFAPSVLAACGLPAREADFLDGENLLGLWTGGEAPQREALYWHYPHWGNQGASPGGAVREGNFKWIEFFTGDESEARGELYDLSADIGERHDLAASRPELARKLRARLANWRGEVGARMPTRNPLIEEGEAGEDE